MQKLPRLSVVFWSTKSNRLTLCFINQVMNILKIRSVWIVTNMTAIKKNLPKQQLKLDAGRQCKNNSSYTRVDWSKLPAMECFVWSSYRSEWPLAADQTLLWALVSVNLLSVQMPPTAFRFGFPTYARPMTPLLKSW